MISDLVHIYQGNCLNTGVQKTRIRKYFPKMAKFSRNLDFKSSIAVEFEVSAKVF